MKTGQAPASFTELIFESLVVCGGTSRVQLVERLRRTQRGNKAPAALLNGIPGASRTAGFDPAHESPFNLRRVGKSLLKNWLVSVEARRKRNPGRAP